MFAIGYQAGTQEGNSCFEAFVATVRQTLAQTKTVQKWNDQDVNTDSFLDIAIIDTKENTLAAYQKIAHALYGQTIHGRVSLIDLQNPSRALEVICLKQDEQVMDTLIKETMVVPQPHCSNKHGKIELRFRFHSLG